MTRGFSERPWRRYGHDRTYVAEIATGEQLGYRDNKTGDLVPAAAEHLSLLQAWAAAIVSDSERTSGSTSAIKGTPEPAATAATGSEGPLTISQFSVKQWDDIADNRPGQAARARAEAELAERRERVGRFRTWAARALDVHTDERSWRVGAAAEETVGKELETLRDRGWHVLHSIPVGTGESDIDHLLIGPGGVITVNSKHHPDGNVWVTSGQIRVNGSYVPYLRNSRYEAARVSCILGNEVGFPVPTISCLIFRLRDGKLTIKESPVDVLVYRATKAAKAIRGRTGVLNLGETEQVYEAARRSTTWKR
jgi:hypothetical protein